MGEFILLPVTFKVSLIKSHQVIIKVKNLEFSEQDIDEDMLYPHEAENYFFTSSNEYKRENRTEPWKFHMESLGFSA